ncbi:MAG: LysR family transcriptional regulator substrate-binding protein [Solirubrobacteraceae bacterium]
MTLSCQEQLSFAQLAGMDRVTYRENPALRRRLELALDDHGLKPRNAFVCTEMGAVRALVSKGMGIAVIPRSAAEEPAADRAAPARPGAVHVAGRARLARPA